MYYVKYLSCLLEVKISLVSHTTRYWFLNRNCRSFKEVEINRKANIVKIWKKTTKTVGKSVVIKIHKTLILHISIIRRIRSFLDGIRNGNWNMNNNIGFVTKGSPTDAQKLVRCVKHWSESECLVRFFITQFESKLDKIQKATIWVGRVYSKIYHTYKNKM